jgi:hypothetical protein
MAPEPFQASPISAAVPSIEAVCSTVLAGLDSIWPHSLVLRTPAIPNHQVMLKIFPIDAFTTYMACTLPNLGRHAHRQSWKDAE